MPFCLNDKTKWDAVVNQTQKKIKNQPSMKILTF